MNRFLKEYRDLKLNPRKNKYKLDKLMLCDNPTCVKKLSLELKGLIQEESFTSEKEDNGRKLINQVVKDSLIISQDVKTCSLKENILNKKSFEINGFREHDEILQIDTKNFEQQEERNKINKRVYISLKPTEIINLREIVMSKVKSNSINLQNVENIIVKCDFIDKDESQENEKVIPIHQYSSPNELMKIEEKFQKKIQTIKYKLLYYEEKINKLSHQLDNLIYDQKIKSLSKHIDELCKINNNKMEIIDIMGCTETKKNQVIDEKRKKEIDINKTKRVLADVEQVLADLLNELTSRRMSNETYTSHSQ